MRAIDEACATSGISTRTLMENAGRAVADAVSMGGFAPQPTTVLCGPGNNGGDGWVAARLLAERGWDVEVCSLVDREELRGDARDAAFAWHGTISTLTEELPDADLYIDALFGAGLSRPLAEPVSSLVQALNVSKKWVIAVDVPSGLHGDTGAPVGDVCVQAHVTVTFVRKRPAHVLMPGRDLCGTITVADIGAPDAIVAAQGSTLFENDPSLWLDAFPWPGVSAHKHARGHVMAASGGHARSGAARLAARGALRVGAGLVTVLSPPDAMTENAERLDAIMLREAVSVDAYVEAAKSAQCVIVGPAFGTSDAHRETLNAARAAKDRCPFVLDADALTLLAPMGKGSLASDVATPHVGEFKRCFPGLLEKSSSRIEAVRAAAKHAGGVVLLKGPDTVIATPDGRAIVNATGTPFLATAGSGDVLAGLIGGLIGQGMGTFQAAAAGAWLHGKAGEALGAGLIAEDLPEVLPKILNALAPPGLRIYSQD